MANIRRCLVCRAELTKPGPDPSTARPGRTFAFFRAIMPFAMVLCLVSTGVLFIFGAAGAIPLPDMSEILQEEPTESPTPTATLQPTITVPPSNTPLPTPLPPIRYTIKSGDSILQIAIDYDVAPWAINELNNLPPDAILSVGQVLLIPIPTATMPVNVLATAGTPGTPIPPGATQAPPPAMTEPAVIEPAMTEPAMTEPAATDG